jgi:hypothetical protein
MIGSESVPSFKKPSGCKVKKYIWEGPTRIMEIDYECPENVRQSNFGYSIQLEITNFKTPVN